MPKQKQFRNHVYSAAADPDEREVLRAETDSFYWTPGMIRGSIRTSGFSPVWGTMNRVIDLDFGPNDA